MATLFSKMNHVATLPKCFRGGLTLEEALAMAYAEDLDVGEIFIEPPDSNVLTDEEPEDEDDNDINRLSGRQLASRTEITLTNSERIDSSDVNEVFTLPMTSDSFTWVEATNHRKSFRVQSLSKYSEMSSVEIFELLFDDDLINFFLKCFLAILIFSGHKSLPRKRYYWDSHWGDMKDLNLPTNFYFHNLFTSVLLVFLKHNGYTGTGTMRKNRVPKSCPLNKNKFVTIR